MKSLRHLVKLLLQSIWQDLSSLLEQSGQSETVSRELTVQQIHDQRSKLSATSPIPLSSADPEAPPAKSSTQQRSMNSKRLKEPGAYSVERSGIDISVRTKHNDDDDDSVLDKRVWFFHDAIGGCPSGRHP